MLIFTIKIKMEVFCGESCNLCHVLQWICLTNTEMDWLVFNANFMFQLHRGVPNTEKDN
jgi:hypothetical protein